MYDNCYKVFFTNETNVCSRWTSHYTILPKRKSVMTQRPLQYAARVPTGTHGTPSYNPGNPTPEQVEKRKTDPLWMYHRGLMTYAGQPISDFVSPNEKPNGYHVIHRTQISGSWHGFPTTVEPEGMTGDSPWADVGEDYQRGRRQRSDIHDLPPDMLLNSNPLLIDAPHTISVPRAPMLSGFNNQVGRPLHNAVFALQDLDNYAQKGDPYRVWAASIIGGNRHAIPHIVALLRQRDNPAGWWKGWSDLHRRMEREQGDLPPHQVADRIHKIMSALASDPDHQRYITHDVRGLWDVGYAHSHGNHEGNNQSVDPTKWGPDFHPYHIMTDAMNDAGTPEHWPALIKSELANVMSEIRSKPKGNRRFARVEVPVRLTPKESMGSPSMWVIHGQDHKEKFDDFARSAHENILKHLSVAHSSDLGGGNTVVRSNRPMELSIPGAVPFSPHGVVRNLFVPHGTEVAPKMRGSDLATVAGTGPDDVSFMRPSEPGTGKRTYKFDTFHIPANSFKPALEFVHHEAPEPIKHGPWTYSDPLAFPEFTVRPKEPGDPGYEEPSASPTTIPTERAPRPRSTAPNRTSVDPPVAAPKVVKVPKRLPTDTKKLEQRLLDIHNADPNGEFRPEHAPLWYALANAYEKNGNHHEADVARDHADFHTGKLPNSLDDGSSIKREWSTAEQKYKETGDLLGLARDHDRLLARLGEKGIPGTEVPSFIRTGGSESGKNTLQRLENLKASLHDWLNRQDAGNRGSSLHQPLTTTHHLTDLAAAYAKSRLGHVGLGEQEAAGAIGRMPKGDPVLDAVSSSFKKRMGEAASGRPHSEAAQLVGNREGDYAFNRLGQVSDILNPSKKADDIYSGYKTGGKGGLSAPALGTHELVANAAKTSLLQGQTAEQVLQSAKTAPDKLAAADGATDAAREMLSKAHPDIGRAMGILAPVEQLLTEQNNFTPSQPYSKLAASYIKAIAATHDERLIDSKLGELLQAMRPIANTSSEARHFSANHYRIIEEAIRAIVGSGYDMGETGRQWANNEEFNLRHRIRGKLNSEVAKIELPERHQFARKKRKKLKMKDTVLQPWQTGGGSSCYSANGQESALLSELRIVDQQILQMVRARRVIPRAIYELAVGLREQLGEMGMDTALLPLRMSRVTYARPTVPHMLKHMDNRLIMQALVGGMPVNELVEATAIPAKHVFDLIKHSFDHGVVSTGKQRYAEGETDGDIVPGENAHHMMDKPDDFESPFHMAAHLAGNPEMGGHLAAEHAAQVPQPEQPAYTGQYTPTKEPADPFETAADIGMGGAAALLGAYGYKKFKEGMSFPDWTGVPAVAKAIMRGRDIIKRHVGKMFHREKLVDFRPKEFPPELSGGVHFGRQGGLLEKMAAETEMSHIHNALKGLGVKEASDPSKWSQSLQQHINAAKRYVNANPDDPAVKRYYGLLTGKMMVRNKSAAIQDATSNLMKRVRKSGIMQEAPAYKIPEPPIPLQESPNGASYYHDVQGPYNDDEPLDVGDLSEHVLPEDDTDFTLHDPSNTHHLVTSRPTKPLSESYPEYRSPRSPAVTADRPTESKVGGRRTKVKKPTTLEQHKALLDQMANEGMPEGYATRFLASTLGIKERVAKDLWRKHMAGRKQMQRQYARATQRRWN